MLQTKLKPPQGGGNLSFGGVEYKVDEKGYITVPDSAVAVARAHGYTLLSAQELADVAPQPPKLVKPIIDVASMERKELVDYCEENKVKSASNRLTDLRAAVINHIASQKDSEEEEGEAGDKSESDKDEQE